MQQGIHSESGAEPLIKLERRAKKAQDAGLVVDSLRIFLWVPRPLTAGRTTKRRGRRGHRRNRVTLASPSPTSLSSVAAPKGKQNAANSIAQNLFNNPRRAVRYPSLFRQRLFFLPLLVRTARTSVYRVPISSFLAGGFPAVHRHPRCGVARIPLSAVATASECSARFLSVSLLAQLRLRAAHICVSVFARGLLVRRCREPVS